MQPTTTLMDPSVRLVTLTAKPVQDPVSRLVTTMLLTTIQIKQFAESATPAVVHALDQEAPSALNVLLAFILSKEPELAWLSALTTLPTISLMSKCVSNATPSVGLALVQPARTAPPAPTRT